MVNSQPIYSVIHIDEVVMTISRFDPGILQILAPERAISIIEWFERDIDKKQAAKYHIVKPQSVGGLGINLRITDILYWLPLVCKQDSIQKIQDGFIKKWREPTFHPPTCIGVKKNGRACTFKKKVGNYCLTHQNDQPLIYLFIEYMSIPHPDKRNELCSAYYTDWVHRECKYKSKPGSNMCGYHKHRREADITRRKQLLETIDYRYQNEMPRFLGQQKTFNNIIYDIWDHGIFPMDKIWNLEEFERPINKPIIHQNRFHEHIRNRCLSSLCGFYKT